MTRQDFMCKIATGDRSIRLLRTLIGMRKKAAGEAEPLPRETLAKLPGDVVADYNKGLENVRAEADKIRNQPYDKGELALWGLGSGAGGYALGHGGSYLWDLARWRMAGGRTVGSMPEYRALQSVLGNQAPPRSAIMDSSRSWTVPSGHTGDLYNAGDLSKKFPGINTTGSQTYTHGTGRHAKSVEMISPDQMFLNAQNSYSGTPAPAFWDWKRAIPGAITGTVAAASGIGYDMYRQGQRRNAAANEKLNTGVSNLNGIYEGMAKSPELEAALKDFRAKKGQ